MVRAARKRPTLTLTAPRDTPVPAILMRSTVSADSARLAGMMRLQPGGCAPGRRAVVAEVAGNDLMPSARATRRAQRDAATKVGSPPPRDRGREPCVEPTDGTGPRAHVADGETLKREGEVRFWRGRRQRVSPLRLATTQGMRPDPSTDVPADEPARAASSRADRSLSGGGGRRPDQPLATNRHREQPTRAQPGRQVMRKLERWAATWHSRRSPPSEVVVSGTLEGRRRAVP